MKGVLVRFFMECARIYMLKKNKEGKMVPRKTQSAGLAPGRLAPGPPPDTAPTPATALPRMPLTLASHPTPANHVQPPATDPTPVTASDHP